MLHNPRPRQSGAETLEFIVVVFLLVVAVIPALYMLAPSLQKAVCNIVDSLSGTTSDCSAGIIFNDDFSKCPGKWANLMGSLSCGANGACSAGDILNVFQFSVFKPMISKFSVSSVRNCGA